MIKLNAIIAENWKKDGGTCFGVVPKSIWQKAITPDNHNLIKLTNRCLLIEYDNQLVLIDTGMGNKQDEKFLSFQYLFGEDNLILNIEKAGYKKENITSVILTHLHFDHCGGAVEKNNNGVLYPAFPNATYYISKGQYENACNPNPREKASFFTENWSILFEKQMVQLIENDISLFPFIKLKLYNGHTPAQIIPYIEINNKTLVYMGDFIPSIHHIPMPYVPSFDTQPLVSLQEKESFLLEALQNNYILFFEHDFDNECCTLQQTPKGIKPDKIFRISDLQLY